MRESGVITAPSVDGWWSDVSELCPVDGWWSDVSELCQVDGWWSDVSELCLCSDILLLDKRVNDRKSCTHKIHWFQERQLPHIMTSSVWEWTTLALYKFIKRKKQITILTRFELSRWWQKDINATTQYIVEAMLYKIALYPQNHQADQWITSWPVNGAEFGDSLAEIHDALCR